MQNFVDIFFPHFADRFNAITDGAQLVHYTSAEAAYRILHGKQLWARSVHLMNDHSEVRHGLDCLQSGWESPSGDELKKWLDKLWPGLVASLEASFFGTQAPSLIDNSYILSLSEHARSEDKLGRLSMWRAYGGKAGVGLVLDPEALITRSKVLGFESAPVTYISQEDFLAWFTTWVRGLIRAESQLRSNSRGEMKSTMIWVMRTFALATKHPGFREEQEWRLIHRAVRSTTNRFLELAPETIAGIPQMVAKIKFDEHENPDGFSIPQLLRRVIIGPCEDPRPVRSALCNAMDGVGVQNCDDKIWMSHIPLRQR